MQLDTVAHVVAAFYRLTGSESGDPALVEHGEAVDDIAYLFLTEGSRDAQRWMLKNGYDGWRVRSPAIVWTGTDDADGGRYFVLPADFLRAYSNRRYSCIQEASGNRWGREVMPDEAERITGDRFYFRGTQLWIAKKANPPTTAYLDYHYLHPEWTAGLGAIDFPLEARRLIVAEAAAAAMEENWLPGGPEMVQKIEGALERARLKAIDIARPTKQPRQFRKAVRFGNHW